MVIGAQGHIRHVAKMFEKLKALCLDFEIQIMYKNELRSTSVSSLRSYGYVPVLHYPADPLS